MSEAFAVPKGPEPKPPAIPADPSGGDEAKAKAHEMKGHEAEAKAAAKKEGKDVTDDGPKPVSISVAQPPKAKSGGHAAAPAAKPGAKRADHEAPAGKPAAAHDAPQGAAPARGPAAVAAASAIDGDVSQFIAKAPKDESKHEITTQCQSVMQSAAGLAINAPPIVKDKGDLHKGMDGLKAAFGASSENPYAEFNTAMGRRARTVSGIRDVCSAMSSILGKVGIALTVIGLLISITGIGAPLGAPIATLGRVLGIITLVLDVITAALSAYLVYLTAMMLKETPNMTPQQRAKLAGLCVDNANQTFAATMSVALALPGVGKLAGMIGGAVKGAAMGAVKIIGKFLAKFAPGLAKGIGKVVVAGLKRAGAFVGSLFKGGAAKSAEKGVVGQAFSTAKTFVVDTGKAAWGGIKGAAGKVGDAAKWANQKAGAFITGVGKYGGKTIEWAKNTKLAKLAGEAGTFIKGSRVGKMATKVGAAFEKGWDKMDKWSLKVSEGLDKWTGKTALEKVESSVAYYAGKAGAGAERLGASAAEKFEGDEAKTAAADAAKADVTKDATKKGEEGVVEQAEAQREKAAKLREEQGAEVEKQKAEWHKQEVDKARERMKDDFEKWKEARMNGGSEAEMAAAKARVTKDSQRIAKIEAEHKAEEKAAELKAASSERAAGRAKDGFQTGSGGRKEEFKDSLNYKDPSKETELGIIKEKWSEPKELLDTQKEVVAQGKEEQAGRENKHADRVVDEGKDFVKEHNEHEGGEAAAPKPAVSAAGAKGTPAVSELDSGDGGVGSKVLGMLGSLDLAGATKKKTKNEKAAKDGPPKEAPKEEHAPAGGGEKGGEKGGESAGALPYWPELLVEYAGDMKTMESTEDSLHKYRDAQIAGYRQAVGLSAESEQQKQQAKDSKPLSQKTHKEGESDGHALTDTGTNAGHAASEAGKGDAQKGSGESSGAEGANAAGTPVPDPPAAHWWDKLINLAKKYIVNYIAKALGAVQTWFTNLILKQFAGMSLEEMQAMSRDTSSKTLADAKTSAAASVKADGASKKTESAEAKADENLSEAKKLQKSTQENVKSADELLKTCGEIKKMIAAEIENGNKFLAELNSSKNEEKTNEEKKMKEDAEKSKDPAAHGNEPAAKTADDQKEEDKDEADPDVVAQVKQAAGMVASASSEYHTRVTRGFQSAKSALSAEKAAAPDAHNAEEAISVFDQQGGEVVAKHQKDAEKRAAQMNAVTGAGVVTPGEVVEQAHAVEEAATATDQDLKEALLALHQQFDQAYRHEHEAPQGDFPSTAGANQAYA